MRDSGAVTAPSAPPQPPRRPQRLVAHGDERVDEWYGLRDVDEAVIAYLRAENDFTEAQLRHTDPLREQVFGEIVARVEETDTSATVPYGPFEYYDRTVEGLQYPIGCRRPRGGGPEQIVLDENALAAGHEYFSLGQAAVTPDHRLIAYTVDFTGDERYALRVRNLETGDDLALEIPNVYYGIAWYDDCRTLLYTRPDDALRPYQVLRHVLGADPANDEVIFEEPDDRFFVSTSRALSGGVLLIGSESKLTSEWFFVRANEPSETPRVIAPREEGHEYHVEHQRTAREDRFLIVSNAGGARNFALKSAPVDAPQRARWETLVPARDDTRLEAVTAFARFIVCSERRDGLPRLRVLPVDDPGPQEPYEIAFPDPVYTAWVGENAEYDTEILRYGYSSLVQPFSDFDQNLASRTSTLVKQQPVRGGYNADRFVTSRLWAQASDGTAIPISVVHRHDVALDGSAPALVYGYGAYETSLDPVFRVTRLPLLERGFVYAVAHVRGGGELGREWYEGGRLENKRNTFSDFIACAEHLVRSGYTSPERLVARGGSAGGLLMGAVANMRPELFHAIVAEVPFVDVLTTMQDESLPLTVTEWEEWGNPADVDMYRRMREYSPYDNVAPRPYPRMLVTTGLHDSAVQFWEPVKWTARLRANTTSTNPILLKTELDAGHHGPSGRYDAWREEAFVLAFVIDAVGIGAS
jgi:oligopeptidase B